MIPDTAQLLAAPPWLLDLLDTATRVTVLLAAAAITASLLRRAPAQARHQVWTLALAGALLLPVAALVLPAWHLRVLPARAVERPQLKLEDFPPAFDEGFGPSAAAMVSFTPRAHELVLDDSPVLVRARPPLAARVADDVLAPLTGAGALRALPLSLGTWLFGVWLAGIALVLGRVLLDRVQVWYFSQRARRVRDERAELFGRQLARLELTGVKLVELDDVELPMTWGVLAPTVALPSSSRRWSRSRLEAVMLHELAHVRRRDALTQLVASLACALYWFHPLTWFAARQMRVLREYACDDEVLGQGVRPSSYAEEIIGIVNALKREERASSATLAMARRSELGARLLALLDPHIAHARLRRGPSAVLSVAALGLILSAAIVRPAAAEPPGPLPRLTPAESARRKAQAQAQLKQVSPAPAAVPSPAPVAAPAPMAGAAPVLAPTPMVAAAPVSAAAPVPPAPASRPSPASPASRCSEASPAAAAWASTPASQATPVAQVDPAGFGYGTWSYTSDDAEDDEEADQSTFPVTPPPSPPARIHGRNDEEELRRIEAMRQSSRDERELTRSLTKLAHDADFETETSRQAYLAACASLQDDALRFEALKALLVGAPISVETGRGVLAQAQRFQRDEERLSLLSMMDRIRESELMRGPLASAYLDVASQLRSHEALAKALRELLHPREVPSPAVERALELLRNVPEAALRKEVLIEVTDHQRITPAVEKAYPELTAGFDSEQRADAEERLAEARKEHRRGGKSWSFSWSGKNDSSGEAQGDSRRADRDRARAEGDAHRAELDRARAEVQRQLSQERAVLQRQKAQLQENARQLKAQAREVAKEYKLKAKELKQRLERQFGSDTDVDVDEEDPELDLDLGQ